jgi:hypothetical protein
LNPKGVRWESVGTSWSTGGDEVMSGTDCTVVSGTRVTPSKSFASVLALSVCLGLACCGEMALVFVLAARSMPDVPPVGAPAPSTRSTADEVPPPAWPWLPRLLLRRRGGDGASSNVVLPPRGEDVVDSTPAGGLSAAIVAAARRGKEYHVVAAVEGHELKTPEMEHRPGLERLLETAHLELDGKPVRQHAAGPYLARQLSVFRDRGVPGPTSKLSPRAPAQMGRRETEREGERQPEGDGRVRWKSCGLRVCPAPRSGALAVGGYKRPRGRERAASRERRPVSPRAANPL